MEKQPEELPDTIVIGRDRLKAILKDYKEGIKDAHGWPAPTGILISVFLCIAAASSFQALWFLTAEQTTLLVYLLGLGSIIWLVRELYKTYKGAPDEHLFIELAKAIKNTPDYTVIYIIKLTKDEIPRLLVEKKETWECFFLPYVSRTNSGAISISHINDFQKTIASYLGIESDSVSIDHFRDFPLVSEKFSPTDQIPKQFNFDFFFFNVPKEKMLQDYDQSPFKVGGKTFYWKTLDELSSDVKTMERNGDVISHLEKNYTEFFAKTQDSIR